MAAESDFEAYRYALWRGRVTFHDVAGAWFYMSDPELTEHQREPFKRIFPGLLDAFAEPRGGIITGYFCRHIRVAAVLTDIDSAARASEGVPTVRSPRPPQLAGLEEPAPGEWDVAAGAANGDTAEPVRRRWRDRARWWREPAALSSEPAATWREPAPPSSEPAPLSGEQAPQSREGAAPAGQAAAPTSAQEPAEPAAAAPTREAGTAGPATEHRRPARRRPATPRQSALRPFVPPSASSSAIHIEPTFGDPADWQAKALLFKCVHLHYRALEFLPPQPRKICMRLIFGVITALLGALDSRQAQQPSQPDETPLELEILQRELTEAEHYYHRAAQRQAQLEYFVGMLITLCLAVPLLAILSLLGVNPLGEPLGVSLVVGGIGALVSVMTRMTNGNLTLRVESGKWAIRALGGLRPLVGAAFGAVVYVFLAGGLIDVVAPPRGNETLFYAGLAFLAGFTERFAQDAIAGASGAIGVANAARPTGPAPPLS